MCLIQFLLSNLLRNVKCIKQHLLLLNVLLSTFSQKCGRTQFYCHNYLRVTNYFTKYTKMLRVTKMKTSFKKINCIKNKLDVVKYFNKLLLIVRCVTFGLVKKKECWHEILSEIFYKLLLQKKTYVFLINCAKFHC